MVARTPSTSPATKPLPPQHREPAPTAPASATARQLLAARAEAEGTTYENRAHDPAYVEALLRALRERAKDVARVRQRVVQLRAENARRAKDLGETIVVEEKIKSSHGDRTFCGSTTNPTDVVPQPVDQVECRDE